MSAPGNPDANAKVIKLEIDNVVLEEDNRELRENLKAAKREVASLRRQIQNAPGLASNEGRALTGESSSHSLSQLETQLVNARQRCESSEMENRVLKRGNSALQRENDRVKDTLEALEPLLIDWKGACNLVQSRQSRLEAAYKKLLPDAQRQKQKQDRNTSQKETIVQPQSPSRDEEFSSTNPKCEDGDGLPILQAPAFAVEHQAEHQVNGRSQQSPSRSSRSLASRCWDFYVGLFADALMNTQDQS